MARLDRGQLEARLMGILWDADAWMTPRDALELLAPDHPVAYTTIMTVLTRLWEKGRLERRRAGRAYEYRATSSREEYTASRMSELLATCDDRSAALTHLVAAIKPDDRAAIRRALGRLK